MRSRPAYRWLIVAGTGGGLFFGALLPVVLIAASSGPPVAGAGFVPLLIAGFAGVLGAVIGVTAGLVAGLLATAAAAATRRMRIRLPVVALAAGLGAASVTGWLLAAVSGDTGVFSGTFALVGGGIAALGMALLWRFGGACRLCSPSTTG